MMSLENWRVCTPPPSFFAVEPPCSGSQQQKEPPNLPVGLHGLYPQVPSKMRRIHMKMPNCMKVSPLCQSYLFDCSLPFQMKSIGQNMILTKIQWTQICYQLYLSTTMASLSITGYVSIGRQGMLVLRNYLHNTVCYRGHSRLMGMIVLQMMMTLYVLRSHFLSQPHPCLFATQFQRIHGITGYVFSISLYEWIYPSATSFLCCLVCLRYLLQNARQDNVRKRENLQAGLSLLYVRLASIILHVHFA